MFLRNFLEASRRFHERPAFVIGGATHSYDALRARAEAVLAALDALPPDEIFVGLVAHDHLDVYAAIVACLFAGRCYVPINPSHPRSRNLSIVEQAGLKTVLTPEPASARDVVGDGPNVVDTRACVERRKLAERRASPDRLAYLLFTSGSSGTPKGVPITVANVDAFLDAFLASAGSLDEHDRSLQMFDLTFDFSVVAYLAPLSRGAAVITVPPGVIKFTYIASLLEESALTQLPLVPSVLMHLRPYFGDLDLTRVKHTYFCGEALHADLLEEWGRAASGSRLTNYYGPTEATVFAMFYRWDPASEPRPRAERGIVSIGKAMDRMQAVVVDGERRRLPPLERGELCLAGPQVTPGYFRDPARNERAFFELDGQRFYRTGDLAYEEADGHFVFLGRVDDQVKVQGYRIELAEIEHHARALAAPSGAVVVDVCGDDGVTLLHLFLEGDAVDAEPLLEQLKDRVPSYMVPTSHSRVAALPLNANGKIDRLVLRAEARALKGAR